jgi:hypothetical protein
MDVCCSLQVVNKRDTTTYRGNHQELSADEGGRKLKKQLSRFEVTNVFQLEYA